MKRTIDSDGDSLNCEIANQRHGEIDVLRAVAIVLMVLFHLVFDLQEFAGVSIDYQFPLWFLLEKPPPCFLSLSPVFQVDLADPLLGEA